MLHKSSLSDYLNEFHPVWVPKMPEDVPPQDICIPKEHILYRLTNEDSFSIDDLDTYYDINPLKDYGKNKERSYAVSMFDDISQVEKLKKFPLLKNKKGIARIVLNPENGVVKQTGNKYHYSWWKTNVFNINSVEMVRNYEKINDD